jgi:ABC-type polysaccharide/polyol phosphate transport system ATPase subunit
MKTAIELHHVSKKFVSKRGGAREIKHHLIKLFNKKLFQSSTEERTVLDDVSFTIGAGEFVGIMGRNGVGKSTILKILAGIYRPNAGSIITHGSIAPVLELGAGFADELSGLENIFLNASILGYSRASIETRLENIVSFSELGDQILDPVRNYSSGMLVRLAFAIACHLDADILLFDEVLAVGDIGFQHKCIKKIKELHSYGKTIVIVSHSPEQIAQYCTRCILLDNAKVLFDGSATLGSSKYAELFR